MNQNFSLKEKIKPFKRKRYCFKNYMTAKSSNKCEENSKSAVNIYYNTQNVILNQEKKFKNESPQLFNNNYNVLDGFIENNYHYRKSYDNINNNKSFKGNDMNCKKYNTLLNQKNCSFKILNINNNNKNDITKIKIVNYEKLKSSQINNNCKNKSVKNNSTKNNYTNFESKSYKDIYYIRNKYNKARKIQKNKEIINSGRQKNLKDNNFFLQSDEEKEIIKNHSTILFNQINKPVITNKNGNKTKNNSQIKSEKNLSATDIKKTFPIIYKMIKTKKTESPIFYKIKNKTYVDNNDIINLINQGNKNNEFIINGKEKREKEVLNISNNFVETIELSENSKNENLAKNSEKNFKNYSDKNIFVKEYINKIPKNQENDCLNIDKIKKKLFKVKYKINSNKIIQKRKNKTEKHSSTALINEVLGVNQEKELMNENKEIKNEFYCEKDINKNYILNTNNKIIDKYIKYINSDNLVINNKTPKNKIKSLSIWKKLKKYHGIKNKTMDDINKILNKTNDNINKIKNIKEKNIYYKQMFYNNSMFNTNAIKEHNNKKNKISYNNLTKKSISPKNQIINIDNFFSKINKDNSVNNEINSQNNKNDIKLKIKNTCNQPLKKVNRNTKILNDRNISHNSNNTRDTENIIFNDEYYKQNINMNKLKKIENIKTGENMTRFEGSQTNSNRYDNHLLLNTNDHNLNTLSSFNKTDIKIRNINFDMPIDIDLEKIEADQSNEEEKNNKYSVNNNKIKSNIFKSKIQGSNIFEQYNTCKNTKIEKLENFINILNEEDEEEEIILKIHDRILHINRDFQGYGKSNTKFELSNRCSEDNINFSFKKNFEISIPENPELDKNQKFKNSMYIEDISAYKENNLNKNEVNENINKVENDEKKFNIIDINIDSPKNDQGFIDDIELIKKNNDIFNEEKKEEKDNGYYNIKEGNSEYEFNLNEEKFYKPLTKYEDKFNLDKINPF